MTKKIGIIFCLFLIGFGFLCIQISLNNNDVTSNKKTDENVINNINKVALYKTDYVYDENIKGYKYEPVKLADSGIDLIKEELNGLKLENNSSGVVYGKYKLVLDDYTIYFDAGNDIALLKNKNYIIKLNNSFKQLIVSNNDTCSCCEGDNCLINLCSCKEQKDE